MQCIVEPCPFVRRLAWAFSILLCLVVVGCASTPTAATGTQKTPVYTLKLRGHSTDHRFGYFEVTRGGELKFGGGRSGAMYETTMSFKLSEEQRVKIWQTIVDGKVLDAESSPFADFKKMEYHVDIWPGEGLGRSFRTVDDQSPGVKALHDLLFQYHLDNSSNIPGLAPKP